MSKLNQEELLSILETSFSCLLRDINYKETKAKYEQAHQQIKEMIQKPKITEKWIEEKKEKMIEILGMAKIHTESRNFIRLLIEEIGKK